MRRFFWVFLWILCGASGMIVLISDVSAEEIIAYDAHGRRDPFVPLITQTSREVSGLVGVENIEEVKVEGVVYDAKNGSIAVVNGSVLQEGEGFGAVKVLKIKPDGVVFLVNGTESFKPLYQDEESKRR